VRSAREGQVRQRTKIVLALILGFAVGGVAVPQLLAQIGGSSFVVAEMRVTDPAGFTEYMRREPATLAPFHGRVVARALPDVREGAPPEGVVTIYAFNAPEDANRWYNSADYAKLLTLRQQVAKARVYFLAGVVSQ
jgi:uncharacterized protein (DUF1330 family)